MMASSTCATVTRMAPHGVRCPTCTPSPPRNEIHAPTLVPGQAVRKAHRPSVHSQVVLQQLPHSLAPFAARSDLRQQVARD